MNKTFPLIFQILLVFILLPITVAYAIDTVDSGYSVAGTEIEITAHGFCYTVNTTNGSNIFVPTKTALEWQEFIANAPPYVVAIACLGTPIK